MANDQTVMSFHSDAVKDGALLVAAAEGVESLAQPFRFELDLVSDDPGLDLAAILRVNARLSLNRTMDLGDGRSGDIAYDYHGMLTELQQVGRIGNSRYRYRAVLRSHLWKLACTRRSRIFTDKSVPDLLAAIFDEAGIAHRFAFADRKAYPINQYSVQYEETDLDFISRWMEHVGISYYYDAEGDLGTLVVIDNAHGYASINPYDDGVVFDDQASTGVWSSGRHQRIRSLEIEETRLPKRVQLKEYNYEAPANEMKYEVEVDADGLGTWYEYNSNYRSESEARFLLGIRRGYWLNRRRRLQGLADHRSFQPGRTFTLKEHFNPHVRDVTYVLLEVRHHLSQADGDDVGTTGEYTCDFTAMPAELAHRPERVTEWPSIHGVVHARIAGGALDYAELDSMGRYKIDVDYDLNDQTIGRVRMAQPSVGEDAGMHFPLRNNTEVLLGHIDGDPDKPIILGAVHDASKPNLVNRANDPLGTISRIKSQGGNAIEMQDDGPHKSLVMANGNLNTVKMFGRPNYEHPVDGSSSENADRKPRLSRAMAAFLAAESARASASSPAVVPPAAPVPARERDASSAHFPAGTTYTISPSLLVDPGDTLALHVKNPESDRIYVWFVKQMTTADEDAFIYVGPSPDFTGGTITKADLNHDDVAMTEAEKLNMILFAVVNGTTTPSGTTEVIFRFTIPQASLNWSWDVTCIPYKRDGARWIRDLSARQFGTTVNCNQTMDHPLILQFFDQIELLGTGSSSGTSNRNAELVKDPVTGQNLNRNHVRREFQDFFRSRAATKSSYEFTGVPTSNKGLSDMAGQNDGTASPITGAAANTVDPTKIAKAPMLPTAVETGVDNYFANYEAEYGGKQSISVGRNIELSYGDSWEKSYGNSHAWSKGDSFEYNLGGNSFSYHFASHDEVSWSKGTVREFSYGDTSKSYSHIGTEESYSKVTTMSKEVSEVQESDSTETVYGVAKSTEHIARKEEFSAVGASVNLAIGGPQFEMSMNGPKCSIEGALLSVGLEIGIGVVEISLAAKLELSAGSTTKLELVNETDLKPKHDDLVVLKTEMTQLKTELGALDVTTQQTEIASKKLEMTNKQVEIKTATTALNKSTLGLYSGIAIFA